MVRFRVIPSFYFVFASLSKWTFLRHPYSRLSHYFVSFPQTRKRGGCHPCLPSLRLPVSEHPQPKPPPPSVVRDAQRGRHPGSRVPALRGPEEEERRPGAGTSRARSAAVVGRPGSTWRSRGAEISAGARSAGGRVCASGNRSGGPGAARPSHVPESGRWAGSVRSRVPASPATGRRVPAVTRRRLGQLRVPSEPTAAARAYLAGEVQLRFAVERLAVLAAVRVEAAVEPGRGRRGPGRPRGAGFGGEHRGRHRRVHRGATPLRRHL